MAPHRIFRISVASVYPHYLTKAAKKGAADCDGRSEMVPFGCPLRTTISSFGWRGSLNPVQSGCSGYDQDGLGCDAGAR